MVGGATYEEALTIRLKNEEFARTTFVMGCPSIYSSEQFMRDFKEVFVSRTDTLRDAL